MTDQIRGLADQLTLTPGKVLFHGTLAAEFTHEHLDKAGPSPIHYVHPPTPDAPAWFADNQKFSLHAAVRFTRPGQRAVIVLHAYQVRKAISMMSLPDMDNFRVFMREQHNLRAPFNGIMEGLALAKFSNESWLEGYAVLKDIVREEPEYVLFPSGLAKLGPPVTRTVNVVPITSTRSKLVDASTNEELAVYTYDGGPGVLV
jgi:hypothetical protein